jgi:hypothetical protein
MATCGGGWNSAIFGFIMTKEELKELIKEAVRDALTVEITLEKVRDERSGQPLAVSERKTEKVFLPSLIVQMLPYQEGAMRGLQQDLTRTKKALDNANEFIKRLADAIERQTSVRQIGHDASDPE